VADTSDRRLRLEAIIFPPYLLLNRIPGFRQWINRIQGRRYERVLKELHTTFAESPLNGHYRLSGGMLLGYYRDGRLLPWDCWDVDFEIEESSLAELAATLPLLLKAGWRRRVTWFNNDGDLAEIRLKRKFIYLDLFVTYDRGGSSASWLFSERDGVWLQAEVHLPTTPTQPVEFIGLIWPAPDPIEPALEARYGQWQEPDSKWDYMTTSSIVKTERWTRPPLSWPEARLADRSSPPLGES